MFKKHFLRAMVMSLTVILLMTASGFALTLRYPQRNDDVADLQRALKQLGYYTKTVDGSYGSGTKAAVRTFQKANGLTADGVAGPKTLAKIETLTGIVIGGEGESGGSGTTTPETPSASGLFGGDYATIEYYDKGERVKTLQRALKALGFDVDADGNFGSGTFAAVKEFQKLHALTTDGKAGKKTLQKLETYFDKNGNCLSGPIAPKPPVTDDEDDEEDGYGVPTRTLRYGMSGDDVKYTQQRLYDLSYYTGSRDGKFGSGMLSAVKAFQKKNGLSADGVIGAGTRKVLFSDDALAKDEIKPVEPSEPETPDETEPDEETRTLRYGMSGEDVARLQLRLKELGYYTGTADGQFGSGTLAAVKAFQQRNGLKADGVCGPDTAKAVYAKDAIGAGSAEETPGPGEEEDDIIPDETLEWGDSGDAVKNLQTRLKALGYYTNKVDGQYGSGTYNAVKAFQQRNNLTVDGKAGQSTLARLYSDDAIRAEDEPAGEETPAPVEIPTRTLRYGMQGEDVALVQQRLIELGFLSGSADGEYGTSTMKAVKAFQQRNGLSADGIAGTKTYKVLFSDNALEPAPTPGVGDTSIIPERSLTSGDSGEDVKSVQQRLKELDYQITVIDGEYGAGTTAAMKAFQQMNGLTATGNGNQATYARLYSSDAITAKGVKEGESVPAYRNLNFGATGNEVVRLQQTLANYKYSVKVTGTYDEQTYQAVLAFQKRNGLSTDGVAGKATQTKIYSGSVITGDTILPGEDSGLTGNGGGPAISQVKLLHWYDDMKGKVIKSGNVLLVYEPSSRSSYYVKVFACGQHADVEPLTKQDAEIMTAAWGGRVWTEKPVYVRLPNGTWCIASTFSKNHEENFIPDNDFDGHVCIHFPRTMTECELNAPKNGVRHQKDIRKHWLAIKGETIPW